MCPMDFHVNGRTVSREIIIKITGNIWRSIEVEETNLHARPLSNTFLGTMTHTECQNIKYFHVISETARTVKCWAQAYQRRPRQTLPKNGSHW